MKRIARASGGAGTPPITFVPADPERSIFRPLELADGPAPCWRCKDAPCVTFAEADLTRPFPVEMPRLPDNRVCPTDAIVVETGSAPQISPEACIGCGLCVVRCPVGAIHLDPVDAVAVVASESNTADVQWDDFEEARSTAARSLSWQAAPFDDAKLVALQLARAVDAISRQHAPTVTRLLVRNAFLVSGDSGRANIPGDNAAWAEVAAARNDAVGLVQIEPNQLSLDAHRRLLAGIAVAVARFELPADRLVPVVVVPALPNVRSDFYRVVADIKQFLGLNIRTVPFAGLYLAIRNNGSSALETFASGFYIDDRTPADENWINETFGADAATAPGLRPPK